MVGVVLYLTFKEEPTMNEAIVILEDLKLELMEMDLNGDYYDPCMVEAIMDKAIERLSEEV